MFFATLGLALWLEPQGPPPPTLKDLGRFPPTEVAWLAYQAASRHVDWLEYTAEFDPSWSRTAIGQRSTAG